MPSFFKGKRINTDEGKSATEKGRERYARQDYEGALQAFTEAIDGSSEHLLVNALDGRAATFEKLGRLRSALRDSKRMIQIMPKHSKGYLRCGKVLQLSDKTELATQIYERGLGKVKVGADTGRVTMQEQYNKLKKTMKPTKTLDPLQYLPLELAILVCRHLAMRDRVICLAVSPAWKHVLESTPDLWTKLDTSYCKKSMSIKSLMVHLRRSKYTLDSALITTKAGYDTERMKFLTRSCKELRELRILGHGLIGESLSESIPMAKKLQSLYISGQTEVSIATIASCMKNSEQIVDMTFLKAKGSANTFRTGAWLAGKNENIKRLELRADKRSQMDITGLVEATPNLISAIVTEWRIMVNIFNLAAWTQLEYLDLTNTQITRFPILPGSLKHLILADNPLLAIHDVPELLTLTSMPLLETFNVHATAIDSQAVRHLTSDAIIHQHLKKFNLGGRMNATPDIPVEQEFPKSESVEELSLALLHLKDDRAMDIVELYPNLRRLDMSGTKITGVAVKDFVKRGIIKMKLDECDSISPDAVEWARGKGIEISYNFPSRTGPPRFADSALARGV